MTTNQQINIADIEELEATIDNAAYALYQLLAPTASNTLRRELGTSQSHLLDTIRTCANQAFPNHKFKNF